MIKMAKAMGVKNDTSGKDFIKALDNLVHMEEINLATWSIVENQD